MGCRFRPISFRGRQQKESLTDRVSRRRHREMLINDHGHLSLLDPVVVSRAVASLLRRPSRLPLRSAPRLRRLPREALRFYRVDGSPNAMAERRRRAIRSGCDVVTNGRWAASARSPAPTHAEALQAHSVKERPACLTSRRRISVFINQPRQVHQIVDTRDEGLDLSGVGHGMIYRRL